MFSYFYLEVRKEIGQWEPDVMVQDHNFCVETTEAGGSWSLAGQLV